MNTKPLNWRLGVNRQHVLEVVHRKGDLGPSREKRGAKVGRVLCDTVYQGKRARPEQGVITGPPAIAEKP